MKIASPFTIPLVGSGVDQGEATGSDIYIISDLQKNYSGMYYPFSFRIKDISKGYFADLHGKRNI